MVLKNQLTCKEASKRLKKLGVKQNSYFEYIYDEIMERYSIRDILDRKIPCQKLVCSAFSVAELGEMLPAYINHQGARYYLFFEKTVISKGECRVWHTYYKSSSDDFLKLIIGTEADARAEMIIYLLENKLIDVS